LHVVRASGVHAHVRMFTRAHIATTERVIAPRSRINEADYSALLLQTRDRPVQSALIFHRNLQKKWDRLELKTLFQLRRLLNGFWWKTLHREN